MLIVESLNKTEKRKRKRKEKENTFSEITPLSHTHTYRGITVHAQIYASLYSACCMLDFNIKNKDFMQLFENTVFMNQNL